MGELPRQSYLDRRLTDEEIAARCAELGIRVNRVEADVLIALAVTDGAPPETLIELTGYTLGQVQGACGCLREQGLIFWEGSAPGVR